MAGILQQRDPGVRSGQQPQRRGRVPAAHAAPGDPAAAPGTFLIQYRYRMMKPVKLFYLRNCPFCKRALQYIEAAKSAHPELAAVEIELVEESERPAEADRYDYYYVPTFYVGGRKVHEGGIAPDEVERVLRQALE